MKMMNSERFQDLHSAAKKDSDFRNAAVKACRDAGILTEALEAGVVKEMVVVMKQIVWLAENGQIVESEPSHCAPIIFDNARSVLAKFGIKK